MSDKLPDLQKVIAVLKVGHHILGPDEVDLAAAAWLERLTAQVEHLSGVCDDAADEIERLTALVEGKRAETIEECAKFIDHLADRRDWSPGYQSSARKIAALVRHLALTSDDTT